jgi:MOSC domain-containing protein YiiM
MVHSVNVSAGGVPKLARPWARVGAHGLEGDAQRDLRHHGGPQRAVSLYSLELIQALQAEGHPISVGSIGENLTLAGVRWSELRPGVALAIGEVALELTAFAHPCRNIAGSFREGSLHRVAEARHPGWSRLYARVVREGLVRVGDPVQVLEKPPSPEAGR